MTDPLHERGMRVRREVLGDEHVDTAAAAATGLTRDFQDLITRYAWGEIWTRPGLDRRTRSCITLACLIARTASTSWRCTCARRAGTASPGTSSRRCCSSAPSTAACPRPTGRSPWP